MTRKEIENLIYDYHWMRKEVDRLEKILWGSPIPLRSVGVAQYGIEATLPKGSRLKSREELEQMELREKRLYERWERYRERVYVIELIAESLEDEHQLIIIDCMMEGMSYRAIAAHLGFSRTKVREIKEEMLSQICQKCHFVHDLKLEKSAV